MKNVKKWKETKITRNERNERKKGKRNEHVAKKRKNIFLWGHSNHGSTAYSCLSLF